ncbi:MAG: NADH-quinone oxidoreductase subunit L [Rhodospirillaceae bacterium]|nr:NADH-quinone oxidoreductase subunit L [Rhodospirillaceae bacterium]
MEVATIFLPLIGCIIAGLFGRTIGARGAMAVTVTAVCVSAVLSIILFFQLTGEGSEAYTVTLFTFIDSGAFEVSWALRFDALTAVMLIVVNGVSSMVHIYSIGYMAHDGHRARFFSYLSLFTFAMLMLITADNLVQLYFGWEGVGLASYLLIGFWHERESARAAAVKAFVVNRIGDFGFALGIFAVFMVFGSVEFDTIFSSAAEHADATFTFLGYEVHALTCACLLLFMGAMGKSAQLGLHTWLPDAMEGPTPVSALIHAATMVTAGVFMVARMSPLFEYAPDALTVVCLVGAATAIVAATIGITQNDIKRVIAYSTMSQLGYMFFALGVSAYSAAIFHLMTHAFFKSLLFLGAGSVIHAMSDEQDMRKMGGIWKQIPYTYTLMWIGSLALAGIGIYGVFGAAGFYSKDLILESAFADHSWFGDIAYWLGVVAAFLTAFYSWRLIIMTFHGPSRAEEKVAAHVHESSWVMLGPLVPLAAGAIFAGWIGYDAFAGHGREAFWGEALFVLHANDTVEAAHHVPFWGKILPLVLAFGGIALAYVVYMMRPGMAGAIARATRPVYVFLLNKWYFDELFHWAVVRPANVLGRLLWKGGDGAVIDGLGPNGIASTTRMVARQASRLQTGYVYHYVFAMLVGAVGLVTWYLYTVSA